MGEMDTQTFFDSRPAFSLAEARESLRPEASAATVRRRLKYHVQTGRLLLVARSVYATVPRGMKADRFRPDPFLVAAAVRDDAVFGYYSALALLGVARSTWSTVSAFTRTKRAPLSLPNAKVVFLLPPGAVARLHQRGLGLREVDRLGRILRVTGPERTLLDGLRNPRRVGGVREFLESAGAFPVLDLDLLLRLLEAYDEKVVWAGAGWFLEAHRSPLAVPDAFLARIERHRPRARVYLARNEGPGWLAPRWNLILPEAVRRTEPDAD